MSEELEGKLETIFKNKNFNLLFLGILVSNFGNVIFNFGMGWYILSLTDKQVLASLFVVITMVVMNILRIFGGVVADKFNKVKLLYQMDFLSGVTLILCFFILSFPSSVTFKLSILYIVSFLLSIFSSFFNPASNALLPRIVKEAQYQQAQSYTNIVNNLNTIIGVLFGGILYSIFHAEGIILINGISFLLSGFSEIFIRVKEELEKEKLNLKIFFANFKKDFLTGLNYIWLDKGMVALIAFAILINFALNPVFITFPQYLFNQVLKTSAFEYSLIEICFASAAILLGIYLAVQKPKDKVYSYIKWGIILVFLLMLFTVGLFFLIINQYISYLPFMFSYGGIMFLTGGLLTLVNVPLNLVFMKKIDKDIYGRVITVFQTLVSFVNPLSLLLFALLIDYFNLLLSASVAIGFGFIAVLYLILNSKLKTI